VGKIGKEMLCPRCGKKMSLVAAGYYCLKDDYVVDPLTGKPPIKPECAGYLLGERRTVDIVFDENRLIIRDAASIFHNIPIEDIEELELGEIRLSATDAAAIVLFGVAASPQNIGPTLKVTYVTKTGKNSITLITNMAAELSRKIGTLRNATRKPMPISSASPAPLTAPNASRKVEKFCRYCGAENKTDADFCERCRRKTG
jgi:hypothetical protein